jgi:peroxiredoxin/outer membrane lipoprotein-sorting protein
MFALLALGISAARAQTVDPAKPDAQPAPAVKPDAPATPAQPAPAVETKVSAEARQLLDQVNDAYAHLKSLALEGTIYGNFDVAGEKHNDTLKLSSSFEAPNKFRHYAENDLLCISTGERIYSYLKAKNRYTTAEAPKDRVANEDLPRPIPMALGMENPSLLIALSKEPAKDLIDTATEISKSEDTQIDGVGFPTLHMQLKDQTVRTLVIDPHSHLVRKVITDVSSVLKARNSPDVKLATFTIDYTTVTADASPAADLFAWVPPDGAKDIAKEAAPDETAEAAAMLEGKAAPAFKLKDMEGKQISLADTKGHVVVLDFWATWCGPCRAALPHLQSLYETKRGQGVQFFALDQSEEKDKVQKFIEETKLTVPVLLDSDGEVGGKYFVTGIPQTVVIGKDGKVAKVFIGFGPASAEELAKAVEAALK